MSGEAYQNQVDVSGEAVDPQAVERELNIVAQTYLRIAAFAIGIYFALRGLSYLVFFPDDVRYLLAGPALAGGAYGLAIGWLQIKGRLPERLTDPAFIGMGIALLFNPFWNMYLTGSPFQLLHAGYSIIAIGLGTVHLRLWLVQIVLFAACYFYFMAAFPVAEAVAAGTVLLSAALLSAIAFFARVSAIRKRIALQLMMEGKAEQLRLANAAKDRFLANMTHELRTPLTGVMGVIDLLGETSLDSEQRDLVMTARSSARYLLSIINDILDFSKLEAGKVNLRPEHVNPAAVTGDVAMLLRPQAEAKGIRLDVAVAEGMPTSVMADPIRIGQVLLNLISNAVKFTEKGGVTVHLALEDDGENRALVWKVKDTGAGIPASRLPHIFDRFEQVDSSLTRAQQGTGLGLAIIRELVSLMRGEISATSKLGQGSEFAFSIPYKPAVADGDTYWPVQGKPLVDDPHGARPQVRLLLAEDNPVNQILIEKMLAKEGWSVATVSNGEAAVAAVTKAPQKFDIVLMDVQMPVMDGVEATRIINDKMADPPPVIALTANTMPDDLRKYEAAGMVAHVGKPIDRAQLRQTVTAVLANRAARKAAT